MTGPHAAARDLTLGHNEVVPDDAWWQRQYAKRGESARQAAAEWSRLEGNAGTVIVHQPGRAWYRVMAVAPGESVDQGCLTVIVWYAAAILLKKASSNLQWVVVVERKSTWWRPYRRLRRWNVIDGASAAKLRAVVVRHLRDGDDESSIDAWPDWNRGSPSLPRLGTSD